MTSETKPFPKFMASDGLIILATSEKNGFITGTVIFSTNSGSTFRLGMGYHSTTWVDVLFEDVECEITIK